jgi:chromosome segregation ATPase
MMYRKHLKLKYGKLLLAVSSVTAFGSVFASTGAPTADEAVKEMSNFRRMLDGWSDTMTQTNLGKEKAEREATRLTGELSTAQHELAAKKQELSTAEAERDQLKIDKTRVERELNDLKHDSGKLTGAKDAQIQQLEAEKQRLEAHIQGHNASIATLKSDIVQLVTEVSTLKKDLTDLQNYNEGNLAKYEGEFGTTKGALKRTTSGLFEQALDQRNKKEAERAALEAALAGEKGAHAATAQDRDAKEQARAALDTALQQMTGDRDAKEQARAALEAALNATSTDRDAKESARAALDTALQQMTGDRDAKEQARAALEGALQQMTADRDARAQERDSKEAERARWESEHNARAQERDAEKAAHDASKQTIQALEHAKAALEVELAQTRANGSSAASSLQYSLDAVNAELAQVKQDLATRDSELQQARQELAAAAQREGDVSARLAQAESSGNATTEQLRNLEAQHNSAVAQFNQEKADLSALVEKHLHEVQTQKVQAEETLSHIRSESAALNGQLQEARDQLASVSADRDARTADLQRRDARQNELLNQHWERYAEAKEGKLRRTTSGLFEAAHEENSRNRQKVDQQQAEIAELRKQLEEMRANASRGAFNEEQASDFLLRLAETRPAYERSRGEEVAAGEETMAKDPKQMINEELLPLEIPSIDTNLSAIDFEKALFEAFARRQGYDPSDTESMKKSQERMEKEIQSIWLQLVS